MSVLDSVRLLPEERDGNVASTSAMEVEDDTEWVNVVYSQLNGTPARNVSTRWQRLNKHRLFIGVLSFVLMCLGLVLAVPRSSCVSSLIPSMGTDCKSVTTLSYIIAGLLCLTGFLGCLASYKGLHLSLSCCLAVLFLCYAVLCGGSAGLVIYSRLHQLENLESAWRQLVAVKSPVVCDIEKTLQCSGFAAGQCCSGTPLVEGSKESRTVAVSEDQTPCFFQAANGSTYDVHNRSEISWPGTMCLSSCAEWNLKTTATCDAPLKSMVKTYFFHFVLVLSALTVFFGVLGCVTIAGMLWRPIIDSRMEHRF
ncbi:hypothetical protein ABB37_07649 [Leptomonas pyrrhocoris]|uniref:Tetraspanin n=1 Tax=Leptomonas pyrrhocoris TaxID=157538 RepID=A0A0N0VE43_LEPPY|nr:hypothetical protein ABB37_07649 [Leptomonas pyrrhocoris]KPA76851.1 hypothetical protein ABB37_07649 [Leptomonas pyrrhocoris]|eukprot:XP_015655290.1 hypothetical protein ABB37_07649 [Leptomonas pyrrhocoris]